MGEVAIWVAVMAPVFVAALHCVWERHKAEQWDYTTFHMTIEIPVPPNTERRQ